MSQAFSGIPFIAGSIFGERSFNVGRKGVLHSPQVAHEWTPGEQVAECKADPMSRMIGWPMEKINDVFSKYIPKGVEIRNIEQQVNWSAEGFGPKYMFLIEWVVPYGVRITDAAGSWASTTEVRYSDNANTTAGRTRVPMDQLMADLGEIEHRPETCTCGFYAYIEGNNEYAARHRVAGIIEGYGETWIGTRGFRTQKARIVAVAKCPAAAGQTFDTFFGTTPVVDDDLLIVVAKRYGVPWFPTPEKMKREFPTTQLVDVAVR